MSWLAALGFFSRAPDERAQAEIEADVRAEIEHHLACAESELVEHGRSPEQARIEARQRFGNVERVRVVCLRLQMGERFMLQRLHFLATLLLLLAVLGLVWSNLALRSDAREEVQSQRFVAEQLRAALVAVRLREPRVIQAGDQLELIDVHGGMHVTETVAADGRMLVPEVGWVSVVGLTREEAEALLTRMLGAYFVEPDIKVKVLSRLTFGSILFESF